MYIPRHVPPAATKGEIELALKVRCTQKRENNGCCHLNVPAVRPFQCANDCDLFNDDSSNNEKTLLQSRLCDLEKHLFLLGVHSVSAEKTEIEC